MTDWRPVYDAATLNDVDALHRLEADDHSLIQSDPVEGCTPLFSACWHGCSEAVSFILHNHDGQCAISDVFLQSAVGPKHTFLVFSSITGLKCLFTCTRWKRNSFPHLPHMYSKVSTVFRSYRIFP